MTLLTLFGLPMSLADHRQVTYVDMQRWCKKTGFQLQKTVGAIYRFAWEEGAVEDMLDKAGEMEGVDTDALYSIARSRLEDVRRIQEKEAQENRI